ncbi:hypothetical protein CJ195_09945 [Bacillus sp. UMB0899]|nr:hypothetical protein CJ195_09945 [Bacillus sp. UMB0899]
MLLIRNKCLKVKNKSNAFKTMSDPYEMLEAHKEHFRQFSKQLKCKNKGKGKMKIHLSLCI